VTDEVASFLGPATHALARAGREQAVVMIDEIRLRHHLASLHESAELFMAQARANPLKQWRTMRSASISAMRGGSLHAVHLHGLLPGLIGAYAARAAGVNVPMFFSPHGSRSISTLRSVGVLTSLIAKPLLRASKSTAIVNMSQEVRAFERWKSAELVESPVGEVFFEVARHEARHPLVVTGGRARSERSAELFAQLAVLLSGEDLRVSFNWVGIVDELSRVRLNAAGVSVFDVTSDAECAAKLAAGWVYLAPGGTRGFPVFLVEAMAAGLPCVAIDVPQHREIIRDGETGYLCRTEREMVERIAMLVDAPVLRQQLGTAARADAKRRFSEVDFGVRLLAAYALPS
jgi:glycosyltransferase involved in cell wall biosynthesis